MVSVKVLGFPRSRPQNYTPLHICRFSIFRRCCSGAMDWYHALPPITRALLTVYLATGLAAWAGVLPLQFLYHDWRLEFKRVPEVRRSAGPKE